jgi:hypothetical protein
MSARGATRRPALELLEGAERRVATEADRVLTLIHARHAVRVAKGVVALGDDHAAGDRAVADVGRAGVGVVAVEHQRTGTFLEDAGTEPDLAGDRARAGCDSNDLVATHEVDRSAHGHLVTQTKHSRVVVEGVEDRARPAQCGK